MALETVKYHFDDFREIEFKDIPSLDIPHIETDHVLMPKDESPYMVFLAHVSKDYRPLGGCPYCHSDDLKLEGYASKPRKVHDVNRNNLRVDIILFPPRMSCKTCKAKFTPEIEAISGSRQMTTRLEEYLRKEVFLQPFSILAERSGLSISSISRIMDEEAAKYEAKRQADPPQAPRVLGIDEKHLGNIMRGTLVDIEKGILLDILVDNKRDTMIEGIKGLKDWDKRIEVVTCDMNNAYVSWIRTELPNVTIVIDRFHVVKNIEKSITGCRKALLDYRRKKLQEVPDELERARQSEVFGLVTKYNKIFHKSAEELARNEERQQQLHTIIATFPEFEMLHNLHFGVDSLYKMTNLKDAEKIWDAWFKIMPPGGPVQYEEWCKKYDMEPQLFDNWRSLSRHGFQMYKPYILNFFNSPDTRFTNAVTEGLNSMIGDVNIMGKGYSFENLRAKCLYAPLIHERTIYSIDLKTIEKWNLADARMAFMMHYGRPTSATLYTETRECLITELNVYKDNDWLTESLSDEIAYERERFKYSIARMDPANELPPMSDEHVIYDIELEDDNKRLTYYYDNL